MAKRVVVVIRSAPFTDLRAHEGLRQAVGLFIKDHQVTVILLDSGVLAALPLQAAAVGAAGLQQHIETLGMLEFPIWAEDTSLARFGIHADTLPAEITAVTAAQVAAALAGADAVIPW